MPPYKLTTLRPWQVAKINNQKRRHVPTYPPIYFSILIPSPFGCTYLPRDLTRYSRLLWSIYTCVYLTAANMQYSDTGNQTDKPSDREVLALTSPPRSAAAIGRRRIVRCFPNYALLAQWHHHDQYSDVAVMSIKLFLFCIFLETYRLTGNERGAKRLRVKHIFNYDAYVVVFGLSLFSNQWLWSSFP